MTPGIFGQRGRIVEHDPDTRLPVEGGLIIGCTVAQIHMNGVIEVVPDEFVPGMPRAEFYPGGWAANGEMYQWRLLEGNPQ